MERWHTLPWKPIQRHVFTLPTRMYRAACREDVTTVRTLQRVLMHSRSAKLLAVRKVPQANQGTKTPGVDGITSFTPPQRLTVARTFPLAGTAAPVRRVWIPTPSPPELRPLGMPTLHDRAGQAVVTSALDPAWEARCAPNSSGFRPGRSCHEAIEALCTALGHTAQDVLDAASETCVDRIEHTALRTTVHTSPSLHRQRKAWLKAGVLDQGTIVPTDTGTMQGGHLSPCLACIAFHGLEALLGQRFPRRGSRRCHTPNVVVSADDLVILQEDRPVVERCQAVVTAWLREMG